MHAEKDITVTVLQYETSIDLVTEPLPSPQHAYACMPGASLNKFRHNLNLRMDPFYQTFQN